MVNFWTWYKSFLVSAIDPFCEYLRKDSVQSCLLRLNLFHFLKFWTFLHLLFICYRSESFSAQLLESSSFLSVFTWNPSATLIAPFFRRVERERLLFFSHHISTAPSTYKEQKPIRFAKTYPVHFCRVSKKSSKRIPNDNLSFEGGEDWRFQTFDAC